MQTGYKLDTGKTTLKEYENKLLMAVGNENTLKERRETVVLNL